MSAHMFMARSDTIRSETTAELELLNLELQQWLDNTDWDPNNRFEVDRRAGINGTIRMIKQELLVRSYNCDPKKILENMDSRFAASSDPYVIIYRDEYEYLRVLLRRGGIG